MLFNIFSGIFGLNKQADSQAQKTATSTAPTFLQQLSKSAVMLGGIVGLGYVFDKLAHLTSDQNASDPLKSAIDTSSTTLALSDDAVSIQETLINPSLLPVHTLLKTDQWPAHMTIDSIPTCTMGLLAISSGQPAMQLAGIALLSDCLKFPGVRAQETNVTFLTTVGGTGTDHGYSVQQTLDGGFIVSGETSSFGAGDYDGFLAKFSLNGTLSWSKTLGGGSTDDARSIQQTQDGGYIALGETSSFGAGGYDLLLTKFTSGGSVSWAKTVGGSGNDYGYSVQQTQDGGYIVTGYTNSFGAGNSDVLLAKLTSTGSLSWVKTLGGATNTEIGQSIQETQDGGYILTGYTISFGAGSTDLLLAKFTSNGTLSWTKTLGGVSADEGRYVRQTQDNGFIVTGYTNSFGAGNYDLLLAKFTSTGILSWAKTLGGPGYDSGRAVRQTNDGGFIVTGYLTGFGTGSNDALLAKFTSTGVFSWAKILVGAGSSAGSSIQLTQDGGLVIAGSSSSNILLAKLDGNGRILNCNATQSINPTVIDITGLVTLTSPSPTITTPSPTVSNWAVSAVAQNLNQNMTCMGKTRTRTQSLPIPETPTFLTTVGGSGSNIPLSMQTTQDGGFITVGQTNGFSAGYWDILLTKFNSNGTLSWTKTLGGLSFETGSFIWQTQDNGFIITGHTCSAGAGICDLYLAKFTQTGSLSWAKTLGGISDEVGTSLQQTQDGGYIVTGYTKSFGAGNSDVLLAKLTSTGTLSWAKTLGGSGNEIGYSVQQCQDGGYIVTGYTGVGNSDVLLAKFTSIGTLSWVKQFGNSNVDIGVAVQQTQDGGYIITGRTNGFGAGSHDLLLVKLTSTGTLSWAKTLGGAGYDSGSAVRQIEDDGFIVTGHVTGFGNGSNDALLAKFTSTGVFSWAKILVGAGNSSGSSIQQTQDGGFVITGTSGSESFLAKLDKYGNIRRCNAMQSINPTVMDITASITITSPALTVTTPSPTVSNWTVSAVSQNMNQTVLCPRNSTTVSGSADTTQSMTPSSDSSSSATRSHLSRAQSLSESPSDSLSIASSSHSLFKSQSQSLMSSKTDTRGLTESLSQQVFKTRTQQPTRTRPVRNSRAVLIQEFNLPITGITKTQLSPSGSFALTQTNTGVQLIRIGKDGAMTPAGQLAISDTIQAMTFSKDERYLFVANDQGNIQVIDLQDPDNPKSKGVVPAGTPIQSLAMSGDGDFLLVGTNTGVNVLSAKTPASIDTMTNVTSYTTSMPVTSIQTNFNTNLVSIGSGNTITLLEFKDQQLTKLGQKTLTSPITTISPTDQTDPDHLTLQLDNGDTVVMNIANSTSPVVTTTISGNPTTLTAISGSTLLVAGVKPGIQIFESTQKKWPVTPEAGYTPVSGPVASLSFSSDGKFGIYSDAQGLKLIKIIKDPGRLDVPLPRLLNVVTLGFSIRNVLLNEAGNWIAVGGNQLTFISRDNLQHPTVLGVLNSTGSVQHMVFFPDKTKLLLVDDRGIAYVDCFNPEAPRLLGRWNTAKTIYGLTLSGSHAYACQGETGISVLDISNPLNMIKTTTLSTQGSAQSIQFNRARSLAYVADGSGIDIWSIQTPLTHQRISRFNNTGLVSALALSLDEKSLYFASQLLFGCVNVSTLSIPRLASRLETTRPIKNILLSNQGTVAYLAAETDGMLIVDTKTMQIKGNLPSTSAHSIALTEFEDKIYVADMEGGLEVAELLNELPIIPLTARTNYPVGIRVEGTLLFFNPELDPVTIDRMNSIQYVNNGQKRDLPLWISADLMQRKISITAPKELTDQPIQLAISVEVEGVRQDTLYQTHITSSLDISADKGIVTIATPSPTVSVHINLTQAAFIPLPSGTLSVSTQGKILQAFGAVADVNHYLQSIRVIPDPISLNQSAIALNPAQIRAADIINLFPCNAVVRLRSFLFNQAPVVTNPMNQTKIKALDSFEITVPPNAFTDSDDPKLTLSAQLINGSKLPSWLTFNPDKAEFNGLAPASMLNKTVQIKITASDGYLSVNSTWQLLIDANNAPFVAKPISSLIRTTSTEFSFVLPDNTFKDLDNNTLTYTAVQNGYDTLPGFLNFDANIQAFLGRPTRDDINTYTIKVIATDKFGATAETTFDIKIKFSNLDFVLYVLEQIGIATTIAVPFSWAYYKRSMIYNTVKRESYWRDAIPKELLKDSGYKPKAPNTEKEIEKDDIVKIHIMAIEYKKCGHDFLPAHVYALLYGKPRLNSVLLPTWMELDLDSGILKLKREHFPTRNNNYVYQVLGKNNIILESFFITPALISMYQAPTNLTEISSIDLGEFELEENTVSTRPLDSSRPIQNIWADLDLEAISSLRPDNTTAPNIPIQTPSAKNHQPAETIDLQYLLQDESGVFSRIVNNHSTTEQATRLTDVKWNMPENTKQLENALSGKNDDNTSSYWI